MTFVKPEISVWVTIFYHAFYLLIVEKLIVPLFLPGVPLGFSAMMSAIVFFGGMVMLMLGLIGEYIGRIYISLNSAPQYVIRETINIE